MIKKNYQIFYIGQVFFNNVSNKIYFYYLPRTSSYNLTWGFCGLESKNLLVNNNNWEIPFFTTIERFESAAQTITLTYTDICLNRT